jgi:Domain of unknown function DUF302
MANIDPLLVTDTGSFPHQVTRLVFDTGQPYDEFRARYEAAVPALDEKRLAEFAARGAAWSQVVADAGASAPHGFLIFWRLDTTPVMSLAGNTARCTVYLMGNHTIAEQMYRHAPAVMLYVPLRTVIYAGPDDRAFFAADQPSTQVASFGLAPVTQVGIDLDRKLAALLRALDLPAGVLDGSA